MKYLRRAWFLLLTAPTFAIGYLTGMVAFGLVSGFNYGADHMRRMGE